MHIFLVTLLFLQSVFADDWVLTTFNRISKFKQPCDDFFRQVCPDSGHRGLNHIVNEKLTQLISEQGKKPWQQLQIVEELNEAYNKYGSIIEEYKSRLVVEKLLNMCEEGEDTTNYLGVLEQLYENMRNGNVSRPSYRLTALSEDKNCSRVTEQLQGVLDDGKYEKFFDEEIVFSLKVVDYLQKKAEAAMLTTNETVRKGVKVVENMIERMKEMAIEQAKVTPWLINSGTVDVMSRIISQVRMLSDFLSTFEQVSSVFLSLERSYLQCKNKLSVDNEDLDHYSVFVCGLVSFANLANYPEFSKQKNAATFDLNAFNNHPDVFFGVPFYYYAGSSADMASILGFVGMTVGHELGHTIVKNYALVDNLVPYFSNKTRDCIQNQFNSTCQMFKENGCSVVPSQIDENGSDFFGLNIAYQLLKDHYGDRLNDKHPQIKMTYHQLFFYATNVMHCDGMFFGMQRPNQETDPHSVGKIRANTIVQNPGFQEAFQCADNSRMMKSKTKTCHILGKEAFQTR